MGLSPDLISTGALLTAALLVLTALVLLSRQAMARRKATITQQMALAGLRADWVGEAIQGSYRGYPVEVRLMAPDGDESVVISLRLDNPAGRRFSLTNVDLRKLILMIDRAFTERDNLREMQRVGLGEAEFDRRYLLLSKPPALAVELLRRNVRLFNLLLLERRGLSVALVGDAVEIQPHVPDDGRLVGDDWRTYLEIGYEIAQTLGQLEPTNPAASPA